MPSSVLDRYRRLASLPLGKWLFARLVCLRAPYFATIRPRFEELRSGYCRVSLRKRRAVQNHIGTVHAIAMANLCELAAGMMMEATLPPGMRWIPRSMSIEYLRKAASDVTATAQLATTSWPGPQDVSVPVMVTDTDGTEVVRATITMYVSPRPPR